MIPITGLFWMGESDGSIHAIGKSFSNPTAKVMKMKTKWSRNEEAFRVGELHSTV